MRAGDTNEGAAGWALVSLLDVGALIHLCALDAGEQSVVGGVALIAERLVA